MNRFIVNAAAAAVGIAFCAAASAAVPMSKEEHKNIKAAIEADYKAAKARCMSLANNPKDVCMAEAKGKERLAMAELEANNMPNQQARNEVRLAKAQAVYDVSKEKCDDLAAHLKDVCVKEAKAVHISVKAEVKANKQVAEARKDAAADKRNADYAVAKEKCEALAGDTKSGCISAAKSQYGQI